MDERIKTLELEEFGFSTRIVNILIRNKISKERLISMTYEELIGLKNMGPDKLDELQKTLESKGYFNIKLPSMRYASKAVKEEYKNSLIDELLGLVCEYSGLKIKKSKIDSLIFKDLRKEYENLSISSLELRITKIKEAIAA